MAGHQKNPDQHPDEMCDITQKGRKHKARSRNENNFYPSDSGGTIKESAGIWQTPLKVVW